MPPSKMLCRMRSRLIHMPFTETELSWRLHAYVQLALQTEAVTRGIKVSASVVFLPDNPMTRSVDVYEYAYSIRFTLLPEEEQLRLAPSARPLASAQLLSRHWVILDEQGACTNTIEGEAVIGKYPHLTHGEYQPLSVRLGQLCNEKTSWTDVAQCRSWWQTGLL